MAAALAHRGPDGEGVWQDPEAGIGLCHRRLAIIDLSPLGAQPMQSASRRFTLTFNGEIYNYRPLRNELQALGATFRGASDTEVLLAAIERWGLQSALERSRGMFALALWDAEERALWLARDRFGEKPLFLAELDEALLFGSELKALRCYAGFRPEIDRAALASLLRHDFIPAPRSIFQGVRKVRPGTAVRIRATHAGFRIEEIAYWAAPPLAQTADRLSRPGELIESVHGALSEAVRMQMVADVPLGAFLSGGIDSSLIVGLMQHASSRPVRTFSIGFDELGLNEAPAARAVAAHLGTEHTELVVTPREALEVVPLLPRIYDEPFADASQIPTYLVARLARQSVTVSLSGDAGDELFGGYSRYLDIGQRWVRLNRTPLMLRRLGATLIEGAPRFALEPLARGRRVVPERACERARALAAGSLPELYAAMTSFWQFPERLVIGAAEAARADAAAAPPALPEHPQDPLAFMMACDARCYLPDDILVKVDRAAMAVSLETRIPMLDREVVRAAARIPTAIHFRDGRGKWVLRQLLQRYVPRALVERPKQGFAVPLARWLRGELRPWAEALLEPARLRREGYFQARPIERRWRQHLAGEMNWSNHLWGVLMFQAWLETFESSGRSSLAVSEPMRSAKLATMAS